MDSKNKKLLYIGTHVPPFGSYSLRRSQTLGNKKHIGRRGMGSDSWHKTTAPKAAEAKVVPDAAHGWIMQRRTRGAVSNPDSRFDAEQSQLDVQQLDEVSGTELAERRINTETLADSSRSILSRTDSPDIGMNWSLNPYRGCEHGCIYCYARPTHEYLGFSAGIDFETRIMVKHEAPQLLRHALQSPKWQPDIISIAGNTDCYQPLEKRLELTRSCLQVLLQHRNPAAIITKSALVLRDLELLQAMQQQHLIAVMISITTLDANLARRLEPRAALPQQRLNALKQLSQAGIPTGVMVAPIIPGLTDEEMPNILRQAAAAGARSAGWICLRLPHGLKQLFLDWLQFHYPEKTNRIVTALRQFHGGKLYQAQFGTRMRGEGKRAQMLAQWFKAECSRLKLNQPPSPFQLSTQHFIRHPHPRQPRLL